MYASGGFMLYGPSHSLPARQQLKEPRLREKDLHLNIARELNNNDNNEKDTKAINGFCSEAVILRLYGLPPNIHLRIVPLLSFSSRLSSTRPHPATWPALPELVRRPGQVENPSIKSTR